jgi:hypothetical protein
MGQNAIPASEQPYDEPPRGRRRGCWLGILLSAIIAMCGGGGVVALLLYMAGEPNTIEMTLDGPGLAGVNETFQVEITLENVSLEPVTVNAIGLKDDLLNGATLLGSEPAYREAKEQDVMLFGTWRYLTYERDLSPGETWVVLLTLQAAGQAGTYSGDVAVWVEDEVLGITLERARRETLRFEVR